MAHKHAEKMKQYAEDAAKHDRPWTQWECRDSGEELWSEMVDHPWWQLYTEYRRKPETVKIIVNGREWVLPKWITEPPDEGKFIAVFDPKRESGYFVSKWCGDKYEDIMIKAYHESTENVLEWVKFWREAIVGQP